MTRKGVPLCDSEWFQRDLNEGATAHTTVQQTHTQTKHLVATGGGYAENPINQTAQSAVLRFQWGGLASAMRVPAATAAVLLLPCFCVALHVPYVFHGCYIGFRVSV